MNQEMASIAREIIGLLNNHNKFFKEVPEGYDSPAIYFPVPEVETADSSLDAYDYKYSWFVKFFDKSTEEAWESGYRVQQHFKQNRNLIPIVNEDGSYSGKYFRIRNTTLKKVDFNVVQLYIRWDSVYSYEDDFAQLVSNFGINFVQ